MSQLHVVMTAALVGPAYLAFLWLAGSTVGDYWTKGIACRWERASSALLSGLLAHALVASVLLAFAPAWTGASLWLLLAGCLVSWRWRRPTLRPLLVPLLLITGYSIACYLLLLSFHFGPARGNNVFWSIYNLTNITPGDSPQAALQAQYLLLGSKLTGVSEFALFDRPFLSGILTAGTLPAFGIMFKPAFYDYTDLLAFAYADLWITINVIAVLPLLSIIERFSSGRSAFIISLLLLASPFLVFNSIGLWPKLAALAIMCFACTQALRDNWLTAAFLSGAAFFMHGSFLWPHIAFCGVIFFYLVVEGIKRSPNSWPQAASVLATCVAMPALWFAAEHLSGGATPLRTYYLYNVPVAYGLHHGADEIAREFYSSTNSTNLMNLPWMNMIKGLLPIETLDLILNYRLSNEATGWRSLGETLFRTQFMRAWFALGLIGGVITWRGLFSAESSRWLPRLAVIAFFILPLIPGLGLYRRDDHFLLPIMMFAVVPVLISFCIGMQTIRAGTQTVVAVLMLSEFLMVYYWRYPPGRYGGEFHAYYIAASSAIAAIAASCIFWPRMRWLPLPGMLRREP